MAQYTVSDPTSGKTLTLTGDSPPTEAELNQIFAQVGGAKTPQPAVQPTTMQSVMASPVGRLVRSDVIDPLTQLALLPGNMVSNYLSMGGKSPNPISSFIDKQNVIPGAIDAPFNAANAAVRNTPGYAKARTEADNITAKNGTGFTHSLIPETTAAAAGLGAWPFGSDAANAAMDSEAQGQQKYAAANPVLSKVANVVGSLLLAPSPSKAASVATTATSSLGDLIRAKNAAYQVVDNSGMQVKQSAIADMVNNIKADLSANGYHPIAGPTLQPNTTAVMKTLDAAAQGGDQTLSGIDSLRKVAKDAYNPLNKADIRLSRRIVDNIDTFVKNLGPSDVTGPVDQTAMDALSNARDLNTRAAKGQQIQNMIDKAALNSKSQIGSFPTLGYGNQLRLEFKKLANNARGMAPFSANEQTAIKQVATGGPIENVLRLVGKLSPDQVIPALSEGAGYAAVGPHALALPVAGAAAKLGATAITARNAAKVSELVRNGAPLAAAPGALSAPSLSNVLRHPLPLLMLGARTQTQSVLATSQL